MSSTWNCKTARLTLLIDPAKKAAFEQLCARQDQTPSQVVRQLIRDYLTQHGVSLRPERRHGRPLPKDRSKRRTRAGRPRRVRAR